MQSSTGQMVLVTISFLFFSKLANHTITHWELPLERCTSPRVHRGVCFAALAAVLLRHLGVIQGHVSNYCSDHNMSDTIGFPVSDQRNRKALHGLGREEYYMHLGLNVTATPKLHFPPSTPSLSRRQPRNFTKRALNCEERSGQFFCLFVATSPPTV